MNKQFIQRVNKLEDDKDLPLLKIEMMRAKTVEEKTYIANAIAFITDKTVAEVLCILEK